MDSTQPEAFIHDTEREMRMAQREEMTTEQRLDRIEYQLRRICAELDICFRAQQALLAALHQQETARKLGEEFEALHEPPDDIRTRDTEPPEAP